MSNYLKLNQIDAYQISFRLSDYVWKVVSSWDNFAKYSIGQQFTRSVDSISANIAEGFGRYHKKDKIKFYYNSRGSTYESLDWLQKANKRELLTEKQHQHILSKLKKLPKEINGLIKFTNDRLEE